jgi:hypothetical protein
LPGVGNPHSRHDARHELVEDAKAAASIWNIPIEIRDAWVDDRPGLAVGAIASIIGPGKLSKLERHRVRDVVLAEKEAYREADRRARLASHDVFGQSVRSILADGVSLANEELRGGHTLREHVGLSRRAMADRTRRGYDAVSTFPDEIRAERAVNIALREHAAELEDLASASPGSRRRLVSDVPDCLGRLLMQGSKRTVAANRVLVVVVVTEEGEPLVLTAFPIV